MPPPSAAPPTSYRFDSVQLFPAERRLVIDGDDAPRGGRAFDLLLALIERRERVVEPNNIAVQIGASRKILGARVLAKLTCPIRAARHCQQLTCAYAALLQSESVTPCRTTKRAQSA